MICENVGLRMCPADEKAIVAFVELDVKPSPQLFETLETELLDGSLLALPYLGDVGPRSVFSPPGTGIGAP